MAKRTIVIALSAFIALALICFTLLNASKLVVKADSDGDGLTDDQERALGTNPQSPDTDNDGLKDGDEVRLGTSPVDHDTDNDGLGDGEEVLTYRTDPKDLDTDDDGLTDGYEVQSLHTNPLKADTDGDGLSDLVEAQRYYTDPLRADTDGDELSDYEEVLKYKTDPRDVDSDDDGLRDRDEVAKGANPLDRDTDDDGFLDGEDLFPLYDASLIVVIRYWEEKDYADPLWNHGDVYFKVYAYDEGGRLIGRAQSKVHANVKSAKDLDSLLINIPDNVRRVRVAVEAWDSDEPWSADEQYDISEELESRVLIISYDVLSSPVEVKSDGDLDGSTADVDGLIKVGLYMVKPTLIKLGPLT
jgi:hypothetical protein